MNYISWDFLKLLLPPAIAVTVVYFFLINSTQGMPTTTAALISWCVGFVVTICFGWAKEKSDDQNSVSDIFGVLSVSFFALWIPLLLEFLWDLIQ